jgi:hypothetical protein
MKFMRRTVVYTNWDHKRNEDILTELETIPITDYVINYKDNWRNHMK